MSWNRFLPLGGLAGQECLVTGCDALVCGWHRFEPCCAQRGPSVPVAQLRVPGQAEPRWPWPGLAAGRGHGAAAGRDTAAVTRSLHGPGQGQPAGATPARPAGQAGARNCPATCPCAKSLRLYKWVLQGGCVPWGLLQNCLRNASKDLDCRLLFLRLS